MDSIKAEGITLAFDPEGGVISDLVLAPELAGGSAPLRPLHRAPWLDSGETLPPDIAPVERKLAGDFFCAPFAQTSEGSAIHGWAANGTWERQPDSSDGHGAFTASYRLRQPVQGAALTKHITLCAGHPVVYQRHVLEGGEGLLPVAHHVMVHVPGGAALSFSPKICGNTAAAPLETDPQRGRTVLAYPQHFKTLTAVRRADGSGADLSTYPFDREHEDLLFLTEQAAGGPAWSAVVAARDGFVFFAVKHAQVLPQTVLWMSNGGRFYPPWNRRHLAVLGIEEAATGMHLSAAHADDPARQAAQGVALSPGARSEIGYAFGAIALPPGWTRIDDVRVSADTITLVDVSSETRVLPFLGTMFGAR